MSETSEYYEERLNELHNALQDANERVRELEAELRETKAELTGVMVERDAYLSQLELQPRWRSWL